MIKHFVEIEIVHFFNYFFLTVPTKISVVNYFYFNNFDKGQIQPLFMFQEVVEWMP